MPGSLRDAGQLVDAYHRVTTVISGQAMKRRRLARWRGWAAHHRVRAGILFAIAYVAFSSPFAERLFLGAAIVCTGELIRFWAAGHLRRNVVVSRAGPYRLVRHPLYLGSLLIGIGLALTASRALIWLGAFGLLYTTFYLPAMRIEELRLESLFGAEYQEYMDEVPRLFPLALGQSDWQPPPEAKFSWKQALYNREPRTVAAIGALVLVQALKLFLS